MGWRNCHRITSPEDTSTRESRPNPTSAEEPAIFPAVIAMTASTTFQVTEAPASS